jgi:hypothetical protein
MEPPDPRRPNPGMNSAPMTLMRQNRPVTRMIAASPVAVLFFAACSSAPASSGAPPACTADCAGRVCGGDGCGGSCGTCSDGQTCDDGVCHRADGSCAPSCTGRACGSDGCGGSCGTCSHGQSCTDGACSGGGDGDSGSGSETGSGAPDSGGTETSDDGGGGSDAPPADAVDSPAVTWGEPCLYNFGSSCKLPLPQECGNHQSIVVTFPEGPQLLNSTLFSGLDCSASALTDNFNDSQTKMGSGIWMFTDDAAVPGVTASAPSSAIWWVGPLTESGLPPPGAPTTGCINYTISMPMCP